MGGRGNRMRRESILIAVSLTERVAAPMPANGMGSSYPLHQLRELVSSHRSDHKMPVIREHAVGDQANRVLLQAFAKHG